MATVKDETALEEIKRRRDEWERRRKEDAEAGAHVSAFASLKIKQGLELAIEILESKGE
jgi:hypothetical protein